MRIGVFGGTFDPPHLGHLVVAQEVHRRLRLDTVLWIPAALPPHKRDRDITDGTLRLDMVRAAIRDDDRFQASDLEIRRRGPSYTVDTLRELHDLHPDADLVLILGADQLAEIETWREPDEIRRLATIAGFARAGEWPADVAGGAGSPGGRERGERGQGGDRVERVEVPRLDISSTEIRRRAGAGEPIRYLVSEGVLRIVEEERPYGGVGGSQVAG